MNTFRTTPSVSFWNLKENKAQSDIWAEINSGLWKQFMLDRWLSNEILPAEKLAGQLPLFKDFQQIVPGTRWNPKLHCLEEELYTPIKRNCTLDSFIDLAQNYFKSLDAHRIGVHLSGGLDSSIIICLLKTLNIPFVPIGFKSNTFEFRTERYIQELLLDYGEDGLLISLEDYPFYSDLTEIPRHQIPMADIKSNASSAALARAFSDRGCDIVFTGQGGDTLFVDAVADLSHLKFNIGNEFECSSSQELYYGPHGIRLISFFANHNIIDALATAALGRKEDALKRWARKWFAPILPKELVDYTYCADFFGVSLGSLDRARPVIKSLFEEAYDLTHKKEFSPQSTKAFIGLDIFSFEYTDYIKFCSLIAVAVWYHSLMNN